MAKEPIVLGYYPSWSRKNYPHSKIPWDCLTHIAHAFVWPSPDGDLEMPRDFLYPELVQTAHEKRLRIIVSVGGWGKDKGFGPMAANPAARSRFVNQLTRFCKTHGYDGADLDWEYPKEKDRSHFVQLVTELRRSFRENKIPLLSAALPSRDWRGGYDIAALKSSLDWFGIMTYDFAGSWTKTAGYNSPLFSPSPGGGSIDDSVRFWLFAKEMPREKLCIGIPFYGRVFQSSGIGKPGTGGNMITYRGAEQKRSEGWLYRWDETSKVGYLTDPRGKQLVTYEDERSIREKCNYLLENRLGGCIIWALGQDDTGTSQPLLQLVGGKIPRPPGAIKKPSVSP